MVEPDIIAFLGILLTILILKGVASKWVKK